MSESNNEILKKQLKENITDSGIEELIITKQKLEEKDDKINELAKKIAEYEELLKRKVADYENLKKRHSTEKGDLIVTANQKLIIDVLPIVDNFEKAIEAAENNSDFNALFDGIKLIEKQFKQVLEKYQVLPLDCVGTEFDPNLHDALMMDETGSYEVDTVIKEWQKGYKMGERVIRHAQVVVGKATGIKSDVSGTTDTQNEQTSETPSEAKSENNKVETENSEQNEKEISEEFVPPKNFEAEA